MRRARIGERCRNGGFGSRLQLRDERGAHAHRPAERAGDLGRLLGDPVGEPRPGMRIDPARRERRRILLGRLGGVRVEPAGRHHRVEHDCGPAAGGVEVLERVELRRRLDEAGEQRRFRQRQVGRALVEIDARGRRHAGRAGAEIDVVQVARQDFVLAEPHVEPHRDGRLADLALQRAVALQVQDFHELLVDRAAALHDLAGRDVSRERPHDPAEIEPPMAVEAPVLDADHRIDERIGKFRKTHIGRLERALAGERLAVRRFEDHRRLGAPRKRGAGRQIAQRPDQRSRKPADEKQEHGRDPADPDGPAR